MEVCGGGHGQLGARGYAPPGAMRPPLPLVPVGTRRPALRCSRERARGSIPRVTDNGDDIPRPQRVSRLAELAHASAPDGRSAPPPSGPTPEPARHGRAPVAQPTAPDQADEVSRGRQQFARLLDEFRCAAVLVPLDPHGSLWTADHGGVRWICAFSDEHALARFAHARGDAGREWEYRTVRGERLLDEMVPKLPGPAGVALDAGSADGVLFPPVRGIVPDVAAVDLALNQNGPNSECGSPARRGLGADRCVSCRQGTRSRPGRSDQEAEYPTDGDPATRPQPVGTTRRCRRGMATPMRRALHKGVPGTARHHPDGSRTARR